MERVAVYHRHYGPTELLREQGPCRSTHCHHHFSLFMLFHLSLPVPFVRQLTPQQLTPQLPATPVHSTCSTPLLPRLTPLHSTPLLDSRGSQLTAHPGSRLLTDSQRSLKKTHSRTTSLAKTHSQRLSNTHRDSRRLTHEDSKGLTNQQQHSTNIHSEYAIPYSARGESRQRPNVQVLCRVPHLTPLRLRGAAWLLFQLTTTFQFEVATTLFYF